MKLRFQYLDKSGADPLVDSDPRINLEMPVELRFEDSARVFLGRTVNISKAGMLVLSEEARPRGTLVHCEFGPGLSGVSEIIWTREAEAGGTFLGMKFQSLGRGARQILVGLLQMAPQPRAHAPDGPKPAPHLVGPQVRVARAAEGARTHPHSLSARSSSWPRF